MCLCFSSLACCELTESLQTIVFSDNYAPINPLSPPLGYYSGMFPMANTSGMITSPTAMLGLYELNPPYAHLNPSMVPGGNDLAVNQPSAQTSPVSPTANVPFGPLS